MKWLKVHKAPRNLPSCFFLLFHAVLFQSLHQLIHPNVDKLPLAKGVTTFPRAVLPKLPNEEPKNPSD